MKFLRQIWRARWELRYRVLLFVLLGVTGACPLSARALVVTEIMYDAPGTDTGREWIELYNDTSDPVQLSAWKLFESNSNHGISASRGDGIISPHEYVVVTSAGVSGVSEYASYAGDVFDSSFSLNNAGESFSFKTPSGSYVAEVSYVGGALASGDGNSLHWIGGQWVSRNPNPGGSPESATGGGQFTNTQNTTGASSTASQSQTPSGVLRESTYTPEYLLTVRMNPTQPIVGAPFVITPRIIQKIGPESKQYTIGIVRITTGDGRQIVRNKTEPVEIVYKRAGVYHLVVQYSQSSFDNEPLASYSADIRVVEPTIIIGREGSLLTITNESDNEIDISGYRVRGGGKEIVISGGTVLLPNTTIGLGDSSVIVRTRPHTIELVSSDGRTKISAREYEPPISSRSIDTEKIHTVRSTPNTSTFAPKEKSENITTISSVRSGVYASVRDRTLVDYNTQPVFEETINSRYPSSYQNTGIVDEYVEVSPERERGFDMMFVSVSVVFVILMVLVTYVYLQNVPRLEAEQTLEKQALGNNVFGDAEEYIIADR